MGVSSPPRPAKRRRISSLPASVAFG
jgi:hypothetical protein